jgi:hypothetical protein
MWPAALPAPEYFAEGDLGASSFRQKREFEFQMSV